MMTALVLFCFSSFNPSLLLPVRQGMTDALSPVLAAVSFPAQRAAEYVRAVSGLATLQEENGRLRQENARLREWYQAAQILRTENVSLQQLLNMSPEPRHRFVSARVIADSGSTYFRTLLVTAGTAQGVTKGQAVMTGEGLVGRVIEESRGASRVLLISDMNSRVPVFIERSGDRAVASGGNSDLLHLDHLSPDAAVVAGDRVLTSGYGGVFPHGAPVGIVERAKEREGWIVRPFADPGKVTFVRVVDTADDPNFRRGGN